MIFILFFNVDNSFTDIKQRLIEHYDTNLFKKYSYYAFSRRRLDSLILLCKSLNKKNKDPYISFVWGKALYINGKTSKARKLIEGASKKDRRIYIDAIYFYKLHNDKRFLNMIKKRRKTEPFFMNAVLLDYSIKKNDRKLYILEIKLASRKRANYLKQYIYKGMNKWGKGIIEEIQKNLSAPEKRYFNNFLLNKYESFNSEVFKTLMFKAQYDSVYNLIKHKPIYMGWYYTFLDSLEKAQALFKKAHYKEGEEYLKLLQRKIKPQYINSRIKVLYYVIKGEEDSIFLFISGLEDKLIDKDAYLEMLFFSLEPDEDLRIAYVMYAVGDIIGAEKLLSNIEKKNAKRLLGIILFKRKRYKKALELFDDTPVGLYYKYLIYTKLKDYKRADEIRNTLLLKYSNTVYAAFIR